LTKKTNYDFIKRQKELEKKRRQEEKKQRKRESEIPIHNEDFPTSTDMEEQPIAPLS
jgi:hypothetical protein